MPIGIAAALIPAAIQLFTSLSQKGKADKFADTKRPDYQIPQAMLEAIGINKDLAMQSELPGQRLIEEKLDERGANTLAAVKSGATSPWEVISGAQRIGEVQSEKIKDLGIASAEYGVGAKSELVKALEGLSRLQENQFMYNEYSPYMNAMESSRQLREASTQNLYSGASNAAGVIANSPDFGSLFSGGGARDSKQRLEGGFSAIEELLRQKALSPNFIPENI